MKRLLKCLLAPAVLLVGLTLFGPDRAEAARWRTHVGAWYPPYAAYAYRYRPYYYPRYYWPSPAVRVHVYRPPVVYAPVYRPAYRYAPAPVVVPYSAPYYQVW